MNKTNDNDVLEEIVECVVKVDYKNKRIVMSDCLYEILLSNVCEHMRYEDEDGVLLTEDRIYESIMSDSSDSEYVRLLKKYRKNSIIADADADAEIHEWLSSEVERLRKKTMDFAKQNHTKSLN